MSKLIALHGKYGEGKFAIVDDEDYEYLNSYIWCMRAREYVFSSIEGKIVYLHRLVLKVTDREVMVDHWNRNRLDNQKHNLRQCTNSQNQANTKSWRGLPHKGVYLIKGRWMARIMYQGKRYFLGYFINKQDAIDVYNEKSKELFGEYAYSQGLVEAA